MYVCARRYTSVDLFVDTHVYPAHSTATDALWAGTPVLSIPSATFQASNSHTNLLTRTRKRSMCAYKSSSMCVCAGARVCLRLPRVGLRPSHHLLLHGQCVFVWLPWLLMAWSSFCVCVYVRSTRTWQCACCSVLPCWRASGPDLNNTGVYVCGFYPIVCVRYFWAYFVSL